MTDNSNITFRKSLRLTSYDYSSVGMYFVTIVSNSRKRCFGQIENNEMVKSDLGLLLERYWINIPNVYKNVKVLDYVIMPNHIHGIIHIVEYDENVKLGNIIKHIKRWISVKAKFAVWQRGYYEHIIRNEKELLQIQSYISNNVAQWELDKLNVIS